MNEMTGAETVDEAKLQEWETIRKLDLIVQEDKDLLTFRRFEKLRRYELLYLQQLLADMTNSLVQEEQSKEGPNYPKIGEIVLDAAPHLKTYTDALLAFEQISKLPHTPKYIRKGLHTSNEGGLQYIGKQFDPDNGWDELSSLASTQKGRIHRYLDDEESLKYVILPKIPGITEQKNDGRFKYSESFMRRIDLALISALAGLLLVVPIATVFVTNKLYKVAIVLPCMLTALCLSSLLTEQTQRNRLTFMIAYAAFLVAFFSNGSST